MLDAELLTGRTTKSRLWKAFAVGRSLRYTNIRMLTLPDQPLRGFDTREHAETHALGLFPTLSAFTAWCSQAGHGRAVSELCLTKIMDARPLAVPMRASGEEVIATLAIRQLAEDDSLEGRLRVGIEVLKSTRQLLMDRRDRTVRYSKAAREQERQGNAGGQLDIFEMFELARLEKQVTTLRKSLEQRVGGPARLAEMMTLVRDGLGK